jgi:hypothetical protein
VVNASTHMISSPEICNLVWFVFVWIAMWGGGNGWIHITESTTLENFVDLIPVIIWSILCSIFLTIWMIMLGGGNALTHGCTHIHIGTLSSFHPDRFVVLFFIAYCMNEKKKLILTLL